MGARSSEFQLLSTVLSVVAPASPQRVLCEFCIFSVPALTTLTLYALICCTPLA